ncbi:MAG: GAF domain-containing SpoIIE family protein phosphatase [Bacteroidota bacterium]
MNAYDSSNLERELHLKQLQINRLLTITQAINDNVSASGLYKMYNSFLSWEMGVKKIALFVHKGDSWECASSIGLPEDLLEMGVGEELTKFQRLQNIDEDESHPLIRTFDIVVPVLHKQMPIAYTFIGGFDEDDDMYSKVQFITTITNVIAVAIENKRLFKRQLEQERLKREMELAAEMQHMLIPSELPQSEAYELASIYKPHMGVGGDYFDFLEFEDGKIYFCIADISGKGVAAALLMANFQANFHSLIQQRSTLDHFVLELNRSLYRITKGDKFMTFFIAEFDGNTRQLRYVNAGHNPPLLVMEQVLYPLNKGCTILGSFKELPGEVEVGQMQLDEEALLLMFTDGLTDIQNESGNFFEDHLLKEFLKSNYTSSAGEFNQRLMDYINEFKGQRNYPDDFTMLTCKIFKQ